MVTTQELPVERPDRAPPAFEWKLWIYTNYDCNLRCRYCVARSSPNVPRRAIGLANVQRLIGEAGDLGFVHTFFTGGEPFLLPDIYDMLVFSSSRMLTTVLTNAMLLHGSRLQKLAAIANENLLVQVSLDGGCAEDHDAFRGAGSWARAVDGIRALQAEGFRVRLGTTETPANSARLQQLCEFHRSLGIPDEDHFVRPLARRGNSTEGLELTMNNLVPEVTANLDGVYWHPLSTDADMLVSRRLFPLSEAVDRIRTQLDELARTGTAKLTGFK
jgi:MoaA/NifB/PqqE/SkfB family radical SAM enzyme